MSYQIYTGIWTDWSEGRVLGATITLSSRNAGLLVAFIATFVAVIAARLWRILSFVAHQTLAFGGEHDGLYYQRQYIFRNTTSPISAVWLFVQQAWYWRGSADNVFPRTIPWAIFGACYVLSFGVLAVFSSEISDAATEFRLVRSADCGLFVPIDRDSLQEKSTYDNLQASIYCRQCYENSSSASCNVLPISSIRWTNNSVECPFGEAVCLDVPAFQMQTGLMDSHIHLGINEPEHNRIRYLRETVCSPLVTQPGFAESVDGAEAESLGWVDDVLFKYLYGSLLTSNYTLLYNTLGQSMQIGYSVWTYYHLAGDTNATWQPTDALALDDRDIALILIAPNSVLHIEPNNDPVFAASIERDLDSTVAFAPDRYLSPIACADRHQVCNPNNNICTPLQGSMDILRSSAGEDLGLNSVQLATAQRLQFVISASTFHHTIFTRTQSFLKAQERVSGLTQLPLPDNQWEMEMNSLFADALSKLQHQMLEYAAGPSGPGEVSVVKVWENVDAPPTGRGAEVTAAFVQMCHNQRSL
ncbi:hypothetical protein QQZ08_005132 [Neonectria magnoliae]|uniref:Uncharacterized protein n=1 Tax=Neonectria magnoliae TaxID=2732573 RepID=A0ABR1I5U3_9HYPO